MDAFYVSGQIIVATHAPDRIIPQMEYDTERAGNFEPLKYLPLGKVAVLGLVTTKNPKVRSCSLLWGVTPLNCCLVGVHR